MGERSVYKIVGGEEDVRGIAKRVAQITVSAIKQMPVLASKVEDCIGAANPHVLFFRTRQMKVHAPASVRR